MTVARCRLEPYSRFASDCLTVPRPGAFAANFDPDVLDRFRDTCKRQGKKYSKVLELLAIAYLDTDGAVLEGGTTQDPQAKDRQVRLEGLQNKLLQDLLKRVEGLERDKVKTTYEIEKMQKQIAFMTAGLKEPKT